MLADIQNRLRGGLRALRHLPDQREPRQGPSPGRATPADAAAVFRVAESLGDCGALRHASWIDASSRLVASLGLPSHHDRQKDWDSLKVLSYIVNEHEPDTPVLDAGSGARSVILNWLSLLGYRRLAACDRTPVPPDFYRRRGISFSVQDMSRTSYADGSFGAIASVSVIEHGVDLPAFFREMHRLLRPGGHLLVSTDYWPDPVDTTGIFPYGVEFGEMKIFTRAEAEAFCAVATGIGLTPCAPVDFTAADRAVRWERVDRDYTFLFVAFRKA